MTPWIIQSMDFSRPEYWSVWPFLSSGDLPYTGIEPGSPTLQADSLPAEPQGKPRNTGAGSLSLLQGIFPTQELNWGLLHCRWILYQLNYKGSQCLSGLLFLLQWITFCQNCSLRPVYLEWPCPAWLMASLSYMNPFTMTRL